jgi:hypothetical protein
MRSKRIPTGGSADVVSTGGVLATFNHISMEYPDSKEREPHTTPSVEPNIFSAPKTIDIDVGGMTPKISTKYFEVRAASLIYTSASL